MHPGWAAVPREFARPTSNGVVVAVELPCRFCDRSLHVPGSTRVHVDVYRYKVDFDTSIEKTSSHLCRQHRPNRKHGQFLELHVEHTLSPNQFSLMNKHIDVLHKSSKMGSIVFVLVSDGLCLQLIIGISNRQNLYFPKPCV